MKKLAHFIATLLLAALSAAAAAHATDDGGGRSVFARGAGDRALALGGAFGAVADDPSAIIWNPAGLARLERKSVYVTHTNLIGLGFSEQLGAVALPNWRLGTFALAIRRFGVDGIEQRDGRGGLQGDNLSDAESEILLGYGKSLTPAWCFGMALKLQQQKTAGYGDAAVGLDLGVMVAPLQAMGSASPRAGDLRVGVALRNLIEPALRLDQDVVPDPSGMRLGAAWSREMSANAQVLLAADYEKTRDMDARLHVGGELTLMRLLSLRIGRNHDDLSAGAGLRWRDFVVDYAYEDNPLAPVHRLGFGVAFGVATAEARHDALAAREEALQDRLNAAFEQENQSRVAGLLAQVSAALDARDWAQALDLVATVRVLDPTYAGLDALDLAAHLGDGIAREQQGDLSAAAVAYQQCLALDAGHAEAGARLQSVRARSDQDAARSAELRGLFDQALAEYAAGNLPAARARLEQIMSLSPGDREAQALLTSTLLTLRIQGESLLGQSRAMVIARDASSARTALDRARELDARLPGLDDAERQVRDLERQLERERLAARAATDAARTDQRRADAAPAAAKARSYADLPPRDQQEAAALYDRGVAALQSGRRDDAIRYWELVRAVAPDYQQVGENLKQEYLAQGMEAFAAGRLDRSIEIWEKALAIDPNDARTRGYLARVQEHKARIGKIQGGR